MKRLLLASIAMTVLLGVCTLDDVLSLHDIHADYVSKSVFAYLGMSVPAGLPSWTDTPLEWTSVRISLAVRGLLIAANLTVLLLLTRRVGRADGAAPAPRSA